LTGLHASTSIRIAAWAEAHGLPQTAETAFMIRGPWPPPGDRDRLYAPITVALG
jgi:hypothetical protein